MTKRNQPCPCGSNIKYKKCCGNSQTNKTSSSANAYQQLKTVNRNDNFNIKEHNNKENLGLGKNHTKPKSAQEHYNLGCTYVERNMLEDAVECFQKAISLQPAAEVFYNLAVIQERLGNLAGAIDSLQEALLLGPDFKIVHLPLGYLFLKTGDFQQAINSYNKALSYDHNNAEAYNNLGVALNEIDMPEEAAANFKKALQLKTDYDEAFVNLGNIRTHQRRYEEAVECFQRVLSENPEHAEALNGLGNVHKDKGDFEEALTAFRKAVTLNPYCASCHFMMTSLRKYSGDEKHIAEMENLFAKKELDKKQRMYLAFGLAKAYEDSGGHERAFDCLVEGNKLKRDTLNYSAEETKKVFGHIKEVFNKSFVSTDANIGIPDNNPIFILGMPRSGTSLVEQILASHSSVYGAGELTYIIQIINHACKSNNIDEILKHIDGNRETTASLLGNEYIEKTRKLNAPAKHITDKMPHNFLWLGLIHLALPNAKIINCKRDPMDNCLSIFKNLFSGGAMKYGYDLHELSNYYLLYKDLMHHWHDIFPPETIYDVCYEKIVRDQEIETRKLLQYCELPWEDNCLSFHKTSRIVATASAAQVRKPIYKDSVQLWRKYEKQLEPLHRILSGKS
ncbi:MAG: sulfotransferase [Desulfobulbaceae bacterium]|nr:sulfotransferase [Desulfobulbaceae bacterium]